MKYQKFIKIISFLLLCVLQLLSQGNNLTAQDSTNIDKTYTLDEVLISTDKLGTKLKDVPTKVIIISSEKIESVNGSRLPALLKNSGIGYIKSYGLAPAQQSISINGLDAAHTLVLLDGVKLNSFQNSMVDLSLIPTQNIERIEIINNGVSSIYGSDALGGVINIITKNRIITSEKNTDLNASVFGGSYNTTGYSLSVYHQTNNFNASIFYNKETSDGNFNFLYDNGKEIVERKREGNSYNLYDAGINSQYIIDESNLLRFISTYSDQDKFLSGLETGKTPPKSKQLDKNWNSILIVENSFSDDLTLRTNLNYQNNYMLYTVEPIERSYYKNLVYSAASEIKYKNENFGIITGYNFVHASLKSNELDNGTKRNQYAFFISSFYDFTKELKIFPSMRYDNISDINENALTYKIGFNYALLKKVDLHLKGNFGKNFRSPSFNDLYWKTGGNKDLQPEHSTNAEAGFIYSFSSFVKGNVDVTFTYIKAKNKIIWRPQSNLIWSPINIAESESKNISINSSFIKSINSNLSFNVDAGIQFTNSKKTSESYKSDPTKNKFIPYIPLQSVTISSGINYKKLELNLFYTHSGQRYSDQANKLDLPIANTLDGNISYSINIFEVTAKLKFEVNNITNYNYEILSGYPMPLRNYLINLSINY